MCEALRELFADDLRDSELKGKLEGKIEQTVKKYKKGYTVKETADMLEETPELISQIYEAILQCASDYNIEHIYQVFMKKTGDN